MDSNSTESIVYVVDDNVVVRDSIVGLLESTGLRCRSFPDAQSFLDSCPRDAAGCLVLDVRMPGRSGLALQRELCELGYSLPVIMITGHGEVPMAVRALKNGAFDFLEKPFSTDSLLSSIDRALAVDARGRRKRQEEEMCRRRLALLSERERQILQYVSAGHYNKVIADKLGLSVSTVETHRRKIVRKLRARSIFDLVRIADLDEDGG